MNVTAHITEMLERAGIENAAQEARWILEDYPDAQTAEQIAQRRAAHEPLQYLLKAWEFYGLPMKVGEGVLAPRQDTETLVETVLARLRGQTAPQILDLCTGSGCIALALRHELPGSKVTGMELSHAAFAYAKENAAALGLDITLIQGDVLDASSAAQFRDLDAIVCNPPYLTAEDMTHLQPEVAFEPETALFGGADGLHYYREITRIWRKTLKPGGLLAYEIGIGQASDVAEILRQNGFAEIEAVKDYCGIERVITGKRDNS